MNTKKSKFTKHSFFMRLALLQAKKNLGNTKTNPSVGCAIVKNNCVIGLGSTSVNGRPHAEDNAIKFCRKHVNKADLYVTLEPCSSYGRTHPCTNKIINNKIGKVFFSINDPDTSSYDKCSKQFNKNNIYVKKGILSTEIKKFYESYIRYKEKSLPFVTAKMALSKDFFSVNLKKKWITNDLSRARVHLMRSNHNCIITSVETIIKDNAELTCRINGLEKYSPIRIVLDKNLKIPVKSHIVRSANKRTTIIFFNKNNINKINKLKRMKIKLIKAPLDPHGNFDLKKILSKLSSLGFSRIFLESGLNLTTNFLNNGLVNNLKLFISSKKLGKNGANSFKNIMRSFLRGKKNITEKVNLLDDRLISYRLK